MIQPLTIEGLLWVMGHLRAKDRQEAHATILSLGPFEECCRMLWMQPGLKLEARAGDGEPAVVGGMCPLWAGLGAGWMFGTDRWGDVALEVTRAVKRTILPGLDEQGLHRIECRPIADHDEVTRWLNAVGFRYEARTAQFGQGREDFVLYARTVGVDPKRAH